MAVYVMSDLHLGFGCGKTMDKFGAEWEDHTEKIREGCAFLGENDILVIPGDVSWGNTLATARADLLWIGENIPGKKVLFRGNHDRFWSASRTEALNREFGALVFLNKGFFPAGEYAVVGTKGYLPEEGETPEQAKKLYAREAARLTASFEAALAAGYGRFLCFTHYPPTAPGEERSVFTDIAEKYGAEAYFYGHLHGEDKYDDSLLGEVRGVRYALVTADRLGFKPVPAA